MAMVAPLSRYGMTRASNMMSRYYVFTTTLTTVAIVQGLSQFSSSSRLSATAGGKSAVWSEADLLKEKAKMNKAIDDAPPIPRNIHITAELLDPKSSFSDVISDAENHSNDDLITTKIVHFQRHGQGYHNLLGDVLRDVGIRPDIFSPDPAVNP